MPVHPQIAARFPLISGLSGFAEAFGDPAADETFLEFAAPYGPYSLPDVEIDDISVAGPHGEILVRRYRPRGEVRGLPGLLWLHGGAFMAGDLDMPEAHVVSAEVAARGVVIVSVDYRLASESLRYPVPLDDVVAAWLWFAASAEELDTDPARLGIGGASAGGNLALAASVRIRDEGGPLPAAMVLAYPVAHFPVPALPDELAAQMMQLPPMLRFTPPDIVHINRTYLGRISDIPVHAMPGHGNLTGLPPTRIVLSEYDDLRGSGELLATQLAEVGVSVISTVAEGMLHGHLNLPPVDAMPEISRSIDFLVDGLLRAGETSHC